MRTYGRKKTLTFYQKVWCSVLILVVYRLLSHIPLPFVNADYISAMVDSNGSLGLLNTFTGGNLSKMSVVALGITPYITASIVLQLLGVVFPKLAALQKEGSTGQKKMKQLTIGLAVVLGAIQSICMFIGYGKQGMLSSYTWYTVLIPSLIMIVFVFFLSFAGQYMTDHFFGNGISLILVTGILCSYLSDGQMLYEVLCSGKKLPVQVLYSLVALMVVVLLFGFTVWLNYCEKKIHVTYSGKMGTSGRTTSQESIIPLKLLGGSVVPIIFASTLLTIPSFIQSFMGVDWKVLHIFDINKWLSIEEPWASLGLLFYFAMILIFSAYYQSLNMNEKELAVSLKKAGGVIAGVRPGRPTELYLKRQMKYLTLLGGLGLCVIAVIPVILTVAFGLGNLSFLGTSIIIVVSVIMETRLKFQAEQKGKFYESSSRFMGIQNIQIPGKGRM